MRRNKKLMLRIALALVCGILSGLVRLCGSGDSEPNAGEAKASDFGSEQVPSSSNSSRFKSQAITKVKFSKVNAKGTGFEKIEKCKLVDHKWNDGDSFYVDNGSKKIHYRLYFVDTAESAYKEYRGGDNNGARLDEQGDYFGGLNRNQTADLGIAAKKFVLAELEKKPFTIFTKNEPVTNRPDEERIHAYVIVKHNGQDVYLHELLVAKGLVRIKTRGAEIPGGRSFYDQRDFLRAMEKTAKKEKVGGWGM